MEESNEESFLLYLTEDEWYDQERQFAEEMYYVQLSQQELNKETENQNS